MNNCKIDFKKKKLELVFNGNMFDFDLRDGDRKDYWNSFMVNKAEYDINLYVSDDGEVFVSVYIVDNGMINTSSGTPIPINQIKYKNLS